MTTTHGVASATGIARGDAPTSSHEPEDCTENCAERTTCTKLGTLGHLSCGVCEHAVPRHHEGHLHCEATPPAVIALVEAAVREKVAQDIETRIRDEATGAPSLAHSAARFAYSRAAALARGDTEH